MTKTLSGESSASCSPTSIRRILATIPVMLMVALFVFSLLYIAPGDPAAIIAGDQATPADVERIRASLGLDRPFLVRFGEWVWHILHGDLGTSIFTNLPVSHMIAQRIEPTLSLMVADARSCRRHRRADGRDRGLEARHLDRPRGDGLRGARLLRAGLRDRLPAGLCLRAAARLAAGAGLHRRSTQGFWPWLRNLILPAVALGRRLHRADRPHHPRDHAGGAAAGLHPHRQAKGVGQRGMLFLHALKNAAVPIVTVIGIGIALLIGGAVVTESVFAIPGLGRLTVDAILRRDYPVIQGVVLLFSFVYVLVNLLVDLLYTLFDPRIRY